MNFRSIILSVLLLGAPLSARDNTDVMVMNNGDRMTCKIKGPRFFRLHRWHRFMCPLPMDLRFWPGAVMMLLIATIAVALVTSSGESTWFVGVFMLMVCLVLAITLYLSPPRIH